MHATLPLMRRYGFPALRRGRLETLQVNLGYKCNQSCLHCHVNAGPTRTEMMSRGTTYPKYENSESTCTSPFWMMPSPLSSLNV